MNANVLLANQESSPELLKILRQKPGENAWAIQDLQQWPERTKLHYVAESMNGTGPFAYLLETGHPGAQRTKTILLRGNVEHAELLMKHVAPKEPWLLRESPAAVLPAVLKVVPTVKVFREMRMEVTRDTYVAQHESMAVRRVVEADAEAFAVFNGAPPHAARGLIEWIRGAFIFGLWQGDALVAMASTFVRMTDVWELIGIKTLPNWRGKGFGAAVTSALTAIGLESAPIVTLTVLIDNEHAIKMYKKIGFYPCEERIWVDHGTGIVPSF